LGSPDGEPQQGKADQRRAGEQPRHQEHQQDGGGRCPPLLRRRLPGQRGGPRLNIMMHVCVFRSQPTLSGVPPLRAPFLAMLTGTRQGSPCHRSRQRCRADLPGTRPGPPLPPLPAVICGPYSERP
jgi:hypothetical protein